MDNAAHLHLLVNHFPIVAAVLAIPLLLLTLVLRKERGLLLASVFLLVVTAATGWASLWTGEEAMDMFDEQDGKAWSATYESGADALGEHEERAENTMWFAYATAALGVVVLVVAHRRPEDRPIQRWWIAILLVGATLTAVGMGYVGNAGGEIMHREIRGDSLSTVKQEDGK